MSVTGFLWQTLHTAQRKIYLERVSKMEHWYLKLCSKFHIYLREINFVGEEALHR